MNTKTQFLNILQAYVDFPTEEIPTDKPFKAVAGIDSFMLIELISSIERDSCRLICMTIAI